MTDRDLTDLLDRTADRITVGAPPLSEMRIGADRMRRRRGRLRAAGVALGVVAVAGGLTTITALDPDPTPDRPAAGPAGTAAVDPPPPGRRLVGVGDTAIAVPTGWATNALRCGTATEPTVVVDVAVIETCGMIGARVYDSVWLAQGRKRELAPYEDIEIDGVPAQRSGTRCIAMSVVAQRLCRATVYLPSVDASYTATARTAPRVDQILSWIRVLPGRVAVSGFGEINVEWQDDDAGERYRAALEADGLQVEVRTETQPGSKAGYVLGVSPAPGTMLAPGDPVVVTVVAEPRGPADELRVGVNSIGPDDHAEYQDLEDEQIRAGTEITLDLGATIWVYGHGARAGTLAGDVSGTALALDDWTEGPNYGRSWEAVERGVSTLTVTITADGEPVTIGTVRVTVR
ncbi:PASTA domain-containing protein [Nocardioides pyridinolyticus]